MDQSGSALADLDENVTPLLCFVNRDSGGRRGKSLLESLRSLPLHPMQICDLKDVSPIERLSAFRSVSDRLHVMCCGGDGTINWVMDSLSSLNMSVASFGIVPLGTGNDLYLTTFQRILQEQQREIAATAGGTGVSQSSPITFSYAVSPEQVVRAPSTVLAHHAFNLAQAARTKSNQIVLDRWLASIRTTDPEQFLTQERQKDLDRAKSGRPLWWPLALIGRFFNVKRFLKVLSLRLSERKERTKVFSNYIGFGVDGAVSLSFSHLRSVAPWLFFSSVLNKLWYGLCGLYQIILGRHRRDLSRAIHITCDGTDVSVPVGIRGLVALNINSYAGGTSLWHADEVFQRGFGARLGSWGGSSMSDGVLEVMGVYGIRHLGLIKSGMASAVPICQGRHVVFNCTIQTPMQIDGEPFMQKPCVVDLALDSRINVTVPVISNVVSNTS